MVPFVRFCKLTYLTYFSQPAADRAIYRTIRKHRVRRILELGVSGGFRTMRMLEVVGRGTAAGPAFYTGVDLFEMRPSGLSLKRVHQQLRATQAKVRLVPGDPYGALARAANDIGECDLIVISADQDRESLAKAWFYFPRMLHATTQVYLEERGDDSQESTIRLLPHAEISRLAAAAAPRRAA